MELVFPTWISFFLECDCSSRLSLLLLGCSSKLGAVVELHSDFLRLLWMVHTVMGDIPCFVGNSLERFLRDFLCVSFVDHLGDESYIIVSVTFVL